MGTVLEYDCDPGYLPAGPSILTCTMLGHWSSEPPRCIRSDGKDKSPPHPSSSHNIHTLHT